MFDKPAPELRLTEIAEQIRDLMYEAETILEKIKVATATHVTEATPVSDQDVRAAAMMIVRSRGSHTLKDVLGRFGAAVVTDLVDPVHRQEFVSHAGISS